MEKIGNQEYLDNGLRILARIIIRKHIHKDMENEGDGEDERDCSKNPICNQ